MGKAQTTPTDVALRFRRRCSSAFSTDTPADRVP
jgi:hypothetical protein